MIGLAGAGGGIYFRSPTVKNETSLSRWYSGQENFYFLDNANIFEMRNEITKSAFINMNREEAFRMKVQQRPGEQACSFIHSLSKCRLSTPVF